MVRRLVVDEMDFVHYQPPAERDNKAKTEKKTLHQKAARRRSPTGVVKLDGRGTNVTSQGSKPRSAGGSEEVETSTRPRLSPEQVWLLERQFQAHSKPSSDMKRQLAEITSLSLPRVANWFQNRRAKAKHQKKQEEAELSLALEAAGQQYPDTCSPDAAYLAGFSAPEIPQATTQAPAVLASRSGIPVRPPLYRNSSSQGSYPSTIVPSNVAEPATAQATFPGLAGPSTARVAATNANPIPQYALYPAYKHPGSSSNSASTQWGGAEVNSALWPSAYQMDTQFALSGLFSQPDPNPSQRNQLMNHVVNKAPVGQLQVNPGQQLFNRSVATGVVQPHETASYLIQTSKPPRVTAGGVLPGQEMFSSGILNSYNAVGSPSESQPGASISSTGLLDLAARRNRPRPAALGLAALRSHSFEGPPSSSPTENAPGSGSSSPVRRIRSAGSGLGAVGGRVQKSKPGTAQRSPLTRTTFTPTKEFDDSYANSLEVMSMVPPSSASTGNSFPPPTPMSPLEVGTLRAGEPGHSALHNQGAMSGHEDVNLAFSIPLNLLTNPASPPATPNDTCLHGYQQNPGIFDGSPSYFASPLCMDQKSLEGPNFSPRSLSFSPQIHMPQPQYASPINCTHQDMTSLLHGIDFFHPGMDPNGQGSTSQGCQIVPEFRIHNASPQRHHARQSPSKQDQRNYTFTNQTPADFD
ncbi:MAG: hypothetical protein M1816_002362 [Peltula sp. TS41687]|nr:MAG: hypothetical protein M1816_002362 [Peltula sp. TS41687]